MLRLVAYASRAHREAPLGAVELAAMPANVAEAFAALAARMSPAERSLVATVVVYRWHPQHGWTWATQWRRP